MKIQEDIKMDIQNDFSQSKSEIKVFEGCTYANRTPRPYEPEKPWIPPGKKMDILKLKECTDIEIDRNPGQEWYIKLVKPCHFKFISSDSIPIKGIEWKKPSGKDPYVKISFAAAEPDWTLQITNKGSSSAEQPSNVTIGDDKDKGEKIESKVQKKS